VVTVKGWMSDLSKIMAIFIRKYKPKPEFLKLWDKEHTPQLSKIGIILNVKLKKKKKKKDKILYYYVGP